MIKFRNLFFLNAKAIRITELHAKIKSYLLDFLNNFNFITKKSEKWAKKKYIHIYCKYTYIHKIYIYIAR